MTEVLKIGLGVNEWLELIKEDENLNGAYISICQYIYIIEKENQELKKQVEYLRSGEYLNQLKFERDILQDIVDNSKILKGDKEFIDMTHRNTELLEENQELKKQLEELNRFKFSCKKDETQIPATIYNKKTVEDISKIKSQQKEFIKYLEDEIEDYELTSDLIFNHNKEMKIYKEILQKYKEITGVEK